MKARLVATLTGDGLAALAARQCNHFFPDGNDVAPGDLMPAIGEARARLEHCFSHVDNRYFFDGTAAKFDHLHGDQYAIWLYLLANQLHRQSAPPALCAKLFLLNKALHGCDIFYEVELPSIFLLVHPVGTVLGRGTYSDYFVAYQRCGVGSNKDIYPRFGRHVTMRPGSAVLGNCAVGDHCQMATEALLLDRDVPDGSLYIGGPGGARVLPNGGDYPLWR